MRMRMGMRMSMGMRMVKVMGTRKGDADGDGGCNAIRCDAVRCDVMTRYDAM